MPSPERKQKVLVIDDEEEIRRALSSILKARNYHVETCSTGSDGIQSAIDLNPDLVILDLTLPDMDGMEVCRELREWMVSPILILSVRDNEADKIAALDTGADDFLTKPFSAGELLARMRALRRRVSVQESPPAFIEAGELSVNIAKREVYLAGEEIQLTKTEFDILVTLAKNANCVVTSKMLLEQIWGEEAREDTQRLRVHVSNLRKKIEPHSTVPRYIHTEPGVGYRFAAV
jgi:two-component system KDP operon response regulator KdpE